MTKSEKAKAIEHVIANIAAILGITKDRARRVFKLLNKHKWFDFHKDDPVI